jgi:hypothetical protein
MLTSEPVGITRFIVRPARANSVLYSVAVRSSHPVTASIVMSNICCCPFAFRLAVSRYRRGWHLLLLGSRAELGQAVFTCSSESGEGQFFGASLSIPWQSPDKSFALNRMWASHALGGRAKLSNNVTYADAVYPPTTVTVREFRG